MKKIKENKEIVIIVVLVLGFLFYWFQLRPVMIKKNCSWFTEVTPADIGITKEQADINKIKLSNGECSDSQGRLSSFSCYMLEKDTAVRPPSPEKTETKEATKIQYDKCLKHNGF
ncbi:MAG: hypothetical protein V4439_04170 [Patescibacteria group bacterium]